ncbi:hypothetical protein OGAPHI_003113 [Ogataea philodendri]|uniref:Uncharacterized protein n=1 Tax=Ogataea philodendri TaxID=1378263 RepID=A0A9P8P9M8_9ASCO|nr:uncharacterized protein OGAPHI_003113 [Ogataea philodendri]KAH3667464.1 hypothetical protein OGAPHI_003113 [Ogataea philodendri]
MLGLCQGAVFMYGTHGSIGKQLSFLFAINVDEIDIVLRQGTQSAHNHKFTFFQADQHRLFPNHAVHNHQKLVDVDVSQLKSNRCFASVPDEALRGIHQRAFPAVRRPAGHDQCVVLVVLSRVEVWTAKHGFCGRNKRPNRLLDAAGHVLHLSLHKRVDFGLGDVAIGSRDRNRWLRGRAKVEGREQEQTAVVFEILGHNQTGRGDVVHVEDLAVLWERSRRGILGFLACWLFGRDERRTKQAGDGASSDVWRYADGLCFRGFMCSGRRGWWDWLGR